MKAGNQELPDIPQIDVLSPLVTVALGQNPSSFSLQGTNTYLVGRGPRKILIDSGEGRLEYLDTHEDAMRQCGCEAIEQIVITHWHHDHLGGVPSIQERFGPNIPVRKFMPEDQEALSGGEGAIDPYSIWPREAFDPLHDGEEVRTEGATLRAIFTPGHANDHVALVLEEEGSMFTADNVLGVVRPLPLPPHTHTLARGGGGRDAGADLAARLGRRGQRCSQTSGSTSTRSSACAPPAATSPPPPALASTSTPATAR